MNPESIELERAALPFIPGLREQHWGLWMLNFAYRAERNRARTEWVKLCEQDSRTRTVESIQEEIVRLQVQYTQLCRLPDLEAVIAVKREIGLLSIELVQARIENGDLSENPIVVDPAHKPIFDALEQQDSVDEALILRSISNIDNLPDTGCAPVTKQTKRGVLRVWRRRIEIFLFDSAITWIIIAVIEGWIK